jgi:hypothetical protein
MPCLRLKPAALPFLSEKVSGFTAEHFAQARVEEINGLSG